MSRVINRECKICNKVIKHETSWDKHLKSKRHIKLSENTIITPQEHHNNTIGTPQEHHNNTMTSQNNTIKTPCIQNQTEIYGKCKYCDKGFKRQQHLSRHEKSYCPVKRQIDEEERKIQEQKRLEEENKILREELKQMKQVITNNTNNTNNINNTNNNTNTNSHNTMNLDNKRINNNHITINNYGNEDYSSLDKEFLKKLSLLGNNIKEKMIRTLDKLYIENKSNHNVRVSNLRDSSYCEILKDEEQWEKEKLEKVLDYRMYNSVRNIIKSISNNNEELDSNTINKTMNNINKYQQYIEESKSIELPKKDIKEFEYIREDHKIKLYNLNLKEEK